MNLPLQFNLDDENEVENFIAVYSTIKSKRLAFLLGIKGKDCVKRANDLSGYAWNKHTAISCRKRGDIATALTYEAICERIYSDMHKSDKW